MCVLHEKLVHGQVLFSISFGQNADRSQFPEVAPGFDAGAGEKQRRGAGAF